MDCYVSSVSDYHCQERVEKKSKNLGQNAVEIPFDLFAALFWQVRIVRHGVPAHVARFAAFARPEKPLL